jgi:flagellar basal body-associated protein FliL
MEEYDPNKSVKFFVLLTVIQVVITLGCVVAVWWLG